MVRGCVLIVNKLRALLCSALYFVSAIIMSTKKVNILLQFVTRVYYVGVKFNTHCIRSYNNYFIALNLNCNLKIIVISVGKSIGCPAMFWFFYKALFAQRFGVK